MPTSPFRRRAIGILLAAGIAAVPAAAQAFNEPAPPGCANAQALTVLAPAVLPGSPIAITVSDAAPGSPVALVISNAAPLPPPGILVGSWGCLLLDPFPVNPGLFTSLIATATADASGAVVWAFTMPALNPPTQKQILFQAVLVPLGQSTGRFSNLAGFVIQF